MNPPSPPARDICAMFDRLLHFIGLERRDHRLSEWSPELAQLFGASPTAAGAVVTPQTALRSATALACIRTISEVIGNLPVHAFQRQEDGSRERDRDSPAAILMAGDWSEFASATDTRTAMTWDALTHGQAFGQILRASDGRPIEIWRLCPTTVRVDWAGGEPVYRHTVNGVETRRDWRDMVHVVTPGSAPGRVICLLDCAREAIGVDLTMAAYQAKLFGQGAKPSGVLTVKARLSDEALKRLRASFEALYAGSSNAGKTVILEDGSSFAPTQMNSTDAQFLELRRLAIEEVARAFGVPGPLVNDLARATWKNVTELNAQFLQMTLAPWLSAWEGALSRPLLSREERATRYLEFETAALLRGDAVARFGAYRQAVGSSWMTPNEARARENMGPVEGGDELVRQAGQAGAVEGDPATADPAKLRAVA